ncbi:endonuclease/exonuclease/phosphatase family protein [Luteolibacter flavescens]|uniref:Endonuclease/exonuclease/phosphatase family protein n=1 Tax=Luteolibacter flavescens TaxID=1859460 RepID=A0ABT3FQP7_9BACT|nr:endonuclease/exonuclease/phosphatase family protein [Luteolibacter flavescens]MCW1885280.1 endonuclease/exonuclease/phosphatase family protein [Luteolibacter flavescens]
MMKRGRWWRRVVQAVAIGGLAIAWAGLLCRGQDGTAITATLHYGTSWLLRLAAGVLAVCALRHWGFRVMAGGCVLVALLEGWHSWRLDSEPSPTPGEITVSVWNAGRDLDGNPAAWPAVGQADVSGVIECGSFSAAEWQGFTAANPGHEWRRFDGSTMLGVRGKILSHESLGDWPLYRCHRVRVMLADHGEMTVVIVDIRSQPWLSREPAMAGILRAAAGDPRTIILGDFNTPPESRWFRPWREHGLSLANDGPRRGFRETWAYGAPLLTLDHIWLGAEWQPRWVARSSHGSDHSMVTCRMVGR